jgi:hypothetical protein
MGRPFCIRPLVCPYPDGADKGCRRGCRGDGWAGRPADRHHANVQLHVAGSGGSTERVRKRHRKRCRTVMRMAEHGDRSRRDGRSPPPAETRTRKRRP